MGRRPRHRQPSGPLAGRTEVDGARLARPGRRPDHVLARSGDRPRDDARRAGAGGRSSPRPATGPWPGRAPWSSATTALTVTPGDRRRSSCPAGRRKIGLDPADGLGRVADGPFAEFDVRWDETGTWLAVWLADATDPTVGRLSLLHLDPATGELDRPDGGAAGRHGAARLLDRRTAVWPGRPRPARTARAAASRSSPGRDRRRRRGRERPGQEVVVVR